MSRGRSPESSPRRPTKAGDTIPAHRSKAGQDRGSPRAASDATAIIPALRDTASQPHVYRAGVVEWNWRTALWSACFCLLCLCVGGIAGVFGERDGLYIAMFGIGAFASTLVFNTIDWIYLKGQRKP